MDRTGPAFSNTATVLGAFEIQVIPENPKQGRITGNIHLKDLAIHIKRNHSPLLSLWIYIKSTLPSFAIIPLMCMITIAEYFVKKKCRIIWTELVEIKSDRP
jgi:hypothetical protein